MVAFHLKEDTNWSSPYPHPPLILRKSLDILIVCFLWYLECGANMSRSFSVAINKSRQLGTLGFRYKPWYKDPGRKHTLRFFHSSRIVRARGRAISIILSLSLLNCQAQWQFLLPSPSPLFIFPLCDKQSSLWLQHFRHYFESWYIALFLLF